MEAKNRSQGLLLAGLFVVLALALWWNFGGGSDGQATAAGGAPVRTTAQAGRRGAQAPDAVVEPIALDRLQDAAPEPTVVGRNPFRFQAQREARPPEQPMAGGGEIPDDQPVAPPAAAGPSGPPPIPLRFIGTVDELARPLKLAVLSDGRNVFYGREGDIIEGRYRILRIGVESIEMAYVDGRGQQTIRLTGS